MNVTRLLIRVNTVVFLALVVGAFGMWRSRRARGVDRRLALALLVSVALQYVLPLLLDLGMLGRVRVDETSNKIMTETEVDRRTGDRIFRAKYSDPESFQDYVYVYDPAEVHFDSYSVNYTRRSRKFNSNGRRRGAGEVFPEDKDLRMVSIPAAAGVVRTYRQPGGSKDPNFVSSIMVQFFLETEGKGEAELEDKLSKFRNMGTKGRFMIKKGGKFEEVERMAGRIR